MIKITLTGFHPSRCMTPYRAGSALTHDEQGYLVVIGERVFFLPGVYVLRGDAYGGDRLYQAAIDLLAHYAIDRDVLARCGFDGSWEEGFRANAERTYRMYLELRDAEYLGEMRRLGTTQIMERAEAAVGRVLRLARPAGLRASFLTTSASRRSRLGLFHAMREILVKASVPGVRERLMDLGVTEEMLDDIRKLQEDMHASRSARSLEDAAGRHAALPLRIAKGAQVGDILMLSQVAGAELGADRAVLYQVGRLFDTASRDAAPRVTPPAPPPAPAPPAAPCASVPPTATTPPGAGTAPAPGDGATGPAQPASAPLPGGVGPAASLVLTPGTVLTTLPARGGPPLSAVVQPDRSIAWVAKATPRKRRARARRR